jgi:hypothetical protein
VARIVTGAAVGHCRRQNFTGEHRLRPYGPRRSEPRAHRERESGDEGELILRFTMARERGQRGGGHGRWQEKLTGARENGSRGHESTLEWYGMKERGTWILTVDENEGEDRSEMACD